MHLIEYLKYILISIGVITGYVLGLSWLLSLIKSRLGLYVVDGTQEEVIAKLCNLLREQGAKEMTVDMKRGKVTIFGLSNIIDMVFYRLNGDCIEFNVKSFEPHKIQVDIFAYRSFMTFLKTFRIFSYTKKEWQSYGYNVEKISELMQKLK